MAQTPQSRWIASARRYSSPHLRLRQVAALVREISPRSMLDVGCCGGFLRTLCPGIEYVGVDMVAPAEPADFPFHRCDLNAEPLPADLADRELIVCCGALEYIECLPAFLQLLHDRLRPGGRLIATYYNMNHISRIWALLRGRSFWVHPDWRGFHSPQAVLQMAEAAGLAVQRVVPTWHSVRPSPRIEQTVDLPLVLPRLRPWSWLLAHQVIFTAQRLG